MEAIREADGNIKIILSPLELDAIQRNNGFNLFYEALGKIETGVISTVKIANRFYWLKYPIVLKFAGKPLHVSVSPEDETLKSLDFGITEDTEEHAVDAYSHALDSLMESVQRYEENREQIQGQNPDKIKTLEDKYTFLKSLIGKEI